MKNDRKGCSVPKGTDQFKKQPTGQCKTEMMKINPMQATRTNNRGNKETITRK
jgi:hypothetical protein